MVLSTRMSGATTELLDKILLEMDTTIVPIDLNHAQLALAAFHQFGKGRHPAGLNFGDCFSYALAKSVAEPLLFKRQDFSKTDISCA
jgi:ribonuclease VapC